MSVISVIICTHNPRADYLGRVLAALKLQTLPKDQWELLLVDNASKEPLAGRINLDWQPQARHLREGKTGLTHARLCGITAASGELLVFVDDDNVLRADYLEACVKISVAFPWLGAWSGSCLPEFEVEPAAELRPWLAGLVIEKITDPVWAKLRTSSVATPMGAGMVVRQVQARHYCELVRQDPLRQTLDRSGQTLGGGGDTDMALCGFDLGLGAGRFPELELTHLIPARRVTLEYLEGIHDGFGYGGVVMQRINQPGVSPKPPRGGTVRIWVKNILWRAAGKSRVERRLRLAEEKGKLRAQQELAKSET